VTQPPIPHPPISHPPPVLVYAVRFVHNAAVVEVNQLGGDGVLWVSTTGAPDEQAHPVRGPLPVAGPTAPTDPNVQFLALTITKLSATSPRVAVICSLPIADLPHSPFDGLPHFRLRANYALPTILPASTGDQWAATVIGRDGDKTDDNTVTAHVGATHQVREGGVIALGAGSGTTSPPQPSPTSELIPFEQAYPILSPRTFQLETDFNRITGEGRSRLRTPGHVWAERRWTHPFVTSDPNAPTLTAVGVGLAMVSGAGSVRVLVHDFEIFVWP